MLIILIIALAVSIDSFTVGIAYGIKNTYIPVLSLVIIIFISMSLFLMSMLSGALIINVLPPFLAKIISAFILITMGIWRLKESVDEYKSKKTDIYNIMKKPSEADIDISGTIDSREALILGFALAVDNLGVGISSSTGNPHIFYTVAAVGIFNLLFIKIGQYIGKVFTLTKYNDKISLLPGQLLIALGLTKLLK